MMSWRDELPVDLPRQRMMAEAVRRGAVRRRHRQRRGVALTGGMGLLVLVMIVLGPFGSGGQAGESDLRSAAGSAASATSTSTGPDPTGPAPATPTGPVPTAPAPVSTAPVPTAPVPTAPALVPATVPEEKPGPMTSETIDYERPGAPPQVPAGVTVEVQLASMTLVPGQPIEAKVRIRNATSKTFYILEGCGVTFVEVINPVGDLVGRSPGEPCGSPGNYFKSATVAAGGQAERALSVTVDPGTAAGPHEVRAAWARDTGAGNIYYISSAPVPVKVVVATP